MARHYPAGWQQDGLDSFHIALFTPQTSKASVYENSLHAAGDGWACVL